MKALYLFITILILGSCNDKKIITENQSFQRYSSNQILSIEDKIANLKDSKNKEIIVVAHRGDWRNAPENSVQAIINCIDMGVDMVEIDVRETKDGHLILMHDETIDRTTTGKGYVQNLTLDSLKSMRLLDGLGVSTNHKIPTLEEALQASKDKILINLDKSYDIFDKCYDIIKKTGTLNQVVIKGAKTRAEVESEFGKYLEEVYFMPILFLPDENAKEIVQDYMDHRVPVAFEFVVSNDTIGLIEEFSEIRKRGASIWVNSLWSHHNGGHDDEKAAIDITTYQWFIENDIDIIQTDRPRLLIDFLKKNNLHN